MRLFLGFLIAIGMIVLVFILVLKAFSGGNNTTKSGAAPAPLVSYANTDTTMQLTVDGPVIANQNHQSVQINIGEDEARINILQGYEGQVVSSRGFANNQASYTNFLDALSVAGYTKGNPDGALADYRGYCPSGERFIYQILDGSGKTKQQYWATSCGGIKTFRGSVGAVNDLFEQQIPNYNELINNLSNL